MVHHSSTPLVTRDASGVSPSRGTVAHLLAMSPTLTRGQVHPDLGAISGTGELRDIVGALLTYGLLTSVTMLIISAITWAIASGSGSWHGASRAKTGVLVAIGGAVLTGGALAWANWLLGVGARL